MISLKGLSDSEIQEIRNAISDYDKVRKDHTRINQVNPDIIDKLSGLEFLVEFGGAQAVDDEERRAKEMVKIYERVRERFSHYVGYTFLSGLKLGIKIPKEVYIVVGNLILDNNP